MERKLGAIAHRFHVSVASLRHWNHLRGSRIVAGKTLQVFARGGGPSPSHRGEYRTESRNGERIYQIQRGDTLGGIARHFHVSVEDLRNWNGIRGSSIVAGKTLKVSGGKRAKTIASSRPAKTNGGSVYHYRIRRGDTLAVIANRFKVSISQIRAWNHLEGSLIMPGQVLTLYGVSD